MLPKLISNLEEVRARGARVLAVASEGFEQIAEHAEHVFYVPRTDPVLSVVLAIVPLQLFAYHLARSARPKRRPTTQPGQDRHGRMRKRRCADTW